MATSLDKLENKVQIHHLHGQCFHLVKRLRKSVQYIWRYSTIYASFWPCHTRRTQISPAIFGVTGQKFTKFLDDVAPSSLLLTCTARPCYCNSFSSTSATNARGISRAMAKFLEKMENEEEIHHPHVKRFQMVKTLRKSVQYVRRYSTKCASFLAVSYLTFTNKPSTLKLRDRISQNSNTI